MANVSTDQGIEEKRGPRVAVVGSANMDLITYAPTLPRLGETIHGTKFEIGFGGKGANQAVMASRLGAQVYFIGKLGSDDFGRSYMQNFVDQEIDVSNVEIVDGESTGVAPITVDDEGNNSIIIVVGANNLVSPHTVLESRPDICACEVLLCQNETPLEATMEAFRVAQAAGTVTVYNPAPAPLSPLPDELYGLVDVLCPNETEAEVMCGIKIDSDESAKEAADNLLIRGVRCAVILTLGEKGTLLATKRVDKGYVTFQYQRIATKMLPADEVVDTTGAGDSFLGAFAFFLARHRMRRKGIRKTMSSGDNAGEAPFFFWDCINEADLRDSVKRACLVATDSVRRPGTQKSYPYAAELPADVLY